MATQTIKTLSNKERLDWLRLIRTENVGPVTFRHLLDRFGDAGSALSKLPELAKRGGRTRPLRPYPKGDAEREVTAVEALGGRFIASIEPDYPKALRALEDAPPIIMVRGHPHLLDRPTIGIVGARNASANGSKFAERIGRELGDAGVTIVSGMARGIDTAAHRGSLPTGTVACLAGGLDHVYPEENRELFHRIGETGVLFTETAIGSTITARHFPRRNRLISGLSLGLLVVEASHRSGSLITARLAAEQGREVFAVPGSPMEPRSEGTNSLIRDGATLVRGVQDILEVLDDLVRQPLREPDRDLFSLNVPTVEPGEAENEKMRRDVLSALTTEPTLVDDLVRHCQYPLPSILAVLLDLELAGSVRRVPGNRVERIDRRS